MGKVVDFKDNPNLVRKRLKELIGGDKGILKKIDAMPDEKIDEIMHRFNDEFELMQNQVKEMNNAFNEFMVKLLEKYDNMLLMNVVIDYVVDFIATLGEIKEMEYDDELDAAYQIVFNTEIARLLRNTVREVLKNEGV